MPAASGAQKSNMIISSVFCCNKYDKIISKVFSSVLVPLLIGIATIIISIIQLQIANKQRSQDLQIATERRETDLRIADISQQNLIVASYIKQMSELILSPNFTLKDPTLANICRAKTLLAIRQLDSQHKTHLIKFLYEARMIHYDEPHINLIDAELDNIDLSARYTDGYIKQNIAILIIDHRYDTTISKVSFKGAFLNNASFSYLVIKDGNFQEASLINANFTGCDLTYVNFVRAKLQNASFRDARINKGIDFKSANLLGADISDALLLQSISIEDAILPNGTVSVQSNVLPNGDAESPHCVNNSSMPSSWHVKQIYGNVSISVASYQANPNVIYPANMTMSSGRCFYAVHGREGQVMMRQIFRPQSNMVAQDGNVILTLMLVMPFVTTAGNKGISLSLHVEQIDRNGISLDNYTKGKIY